MKEHLQKIQALIDENLALKERSPFLDVSLGALRTALDNARQHSELPPAAPAPKPGK